MKTIVINTSKEAKKTKLDILFNAPFDHNSLLRYESSLDRIEETASVIKQALITDADTVDRDYNLIVLVDLYEFPFGDEINAANMYKAFISRYIGSTLVGKLYNDYNLLPRQTAVFYADSAKYSEDFDPEKLDSNIIEQENKAKERYFNKLEARKKQNADEDLVQDLPAFADEESFKEKTKSKNTEELLVMKLFGWDNNTKKENFNWKIKLSIADDTYLDFTDVFKNISYSIEKSHESADVLTDVLNELKNYIEFTGDINSSASQRVESIGGCSVISHTCRFERNNEQNIKEGFFKVYANIFMCVQRGAILEKITDYNKEEIKTLLVNALNKYNHFSDENNILIEFEPISSVYENRSSVLRRHKEIALSQSGFKDMNEEKVADEIMESSKAKKSGKIVNTSKMRGLDLQFHNIVEAIFDNYDSEIIKSQNDLIMKNCMLNLWEWRDRCTNDDFCRIVKYVEDNSTDNIKNEENEVKSESVSIYADKHEQEYNRLVTEITEVEHRLSVNKNILNETRNMVIKYGDLMRKGKQYIVSCIGALLAVLSTVVPFVYIQIYASGKSPVSLATCLLFVAAFSLLYAAASGIYVSYIAKKKYALKTQLEILKENSEKDRKESIIVLYRYYSNTLIEANCHYLLWNELIRREKENAKKGIMCNAHITHLNELKEIVERYITMLKIQVPESDSSDESYKELVLIGNEPFYSDNNKKVYSILPENDIKLKTEEGGEELQ